MKLDQAFVEQIILLALTALISGIVIPYIFKNIDERKLRQGKIIEAQAKLLDDLSQLLWKWRYLAKQVVYYGVQENHERYDHAKKQYDEGVWEILEAFRVEISKSRRLVSEASYEKLDSFYKYIVGDIDIRVSGVIRETELNVDECREIATLFSHEVSQRIDDAMDDLASEVNLKVQK
jgi:F0F1-type ATP synthase membrane subunit b/b'